MVIEALELEIFDNEFRFRTAKTKEILTLGDLKLACVPTYQEFEPGIPLDERIRTIGERGEISWKADYYWSELLNTKLKVDPKIIQHRGRPYKEPELKYKEAVMVLYFRRNKDTL